MELLEKYFLTKEEYTLLDLMHNCDRKGNPYERDSSLYVPLDHICDVELLLRDYISKSYIDSEYYVNMFKRNPLGLNRVEVIKFINRIMLKVFANESISLVIMNDSRSYKVSNGVNNSLRDDVSLMVPIKFDVKDAYKHPIICGKIEFNDRRQELFDIRWGGLLIRNVEYDDVMVVDLSVIRTLNQRVSFSLVNKVMCYNEAKLSDVSVQWERGKYITPGINIREEREADTIMVTRGAAIIDEAGHFLDDNDDMMHGVVFNSTTGEDMPF